MIPPPAKLKEDGWLAPHFGAMDHRVARALTTAKNLTAGQSLWDWAQGHRWYGMHRQQDGAFLYRDWAPNATEVHLLCDFNGWQKHPDFAARRINDHGDWNLRLSHENCCHGMHYRLLITWPGGHGERLPAWGNRMWQDRSSLRYTAQVWDPPGDFAWQHSAPPPPDFVTIYEAHPGMATEEEKVGTWREFRDHILPRIAADGYNTVQLMGVMEHPYYGSFGYHVGSFFAPSSRFGTPEDLKSLVDAAHGLGLRVIMDLVHSHAVKNEVEGISNYDGTPWQFFHDGPRGDHEAWDSRCFNYAKPAVLHFLLSNLRYWLEEYRFDGFRLDGVTSMLYHDHGLGTVFGSYGDYFGGNVDEDAVTYLSLAQRLIREGAPGAITVAEDVSGMPGLAAPLEDGGIGIDYRLAMGIPDTWFKLAKEVRDEDWSMNLLWHELTNRRRDERTISYLESHDQALVGGKSFIFELIDQEMYWSMHRGANSLIVQRGLALHKMARMATVLTAGNGYLNFMGNEFGHPEWIDFPREGNQWSYAKARRLWSLRENPDLHFKDLADFDRELMHCCRNLDPRHTPELAKADDGDKILALRRGGLVAVFNFHPAQSFENYGIWVPSAGTWQLILTTDAPHFGGQGRIAQPQSFVAVADASGGHWLRFYLPSRTAVLVCQD